YIGSCDWMPRNFDRRVEAAAPVESPALHERLRSLLATYLDDNRPAWGVHADGPWGQRVPGGPGRASHAILPRDPGGRMRDMPVEIVPGAQPVPPDRRIAAAGD